MDLSKPLTSPTKQNKKIIRHWISSLHIASHRPSSAQLNEELHSIAALHLNGIDPWASDDIIELTIALIRYDWTRLEPITILTNLGPTTKTENLSLLQIITATTINSILLDYYYHYYYSFYSIIIIFNSIQLLLLSILLNFCYH